MMNEYSGRILLVEDNPNDLELTLHAFEKHPHPIKIIEARDGKEALDFFFDSSTGNVHQENLDLRFVLLDLKLPKIDGLEVLRRIKENPLTMKIPVIILTSSQEKCDLEKAYLYRANSYLVKPMNYLDFQKSLGILLDYWLIVNT